MNLSEPIWTENWPVNLTESGSHTLYSIADFSVLRNTVRKASHCTLMHHTNPHISKCYGLLSVLLFTSPVHTTKS